MRAIYAGTFDPITVGHLDIIERASKLFSELEIGVGINANKTPMFNIDHRVLMLMDATKHLDNVKVINFKGLLVDTAKKRDIDVIVRGLRIFSDFESEFQMALTNRALNSEIETIFLTPKHEHGFISSSMVREVWSNGGDVSKFVPENVAKVMGRTWGLPIDHGFFQYT